MLKFLLIVFIIIYILGYVGKWFLANWIKKVSKQQMNTSEYNQKKEGEITVETNTTNTNKKFKDDGEYVDYEEIKD